MSILASNFTSNSLSGTVTVSNQFANIILQSSPYAFEGNKEFIVKLRRSSIEGLVLLTSPSITLIDNSEAISLTSNINVVPEGGSVKFTFVTANAANNSTLYYSTVSLVGNVEAADFFTSNTGSFTLVDNQGEIVLTTVEDLSAFVEQGERFGLQIRTGSVTGNVVYTDGNILIMDTSNVPGIVSLIFASENIYESEAAVLTVNAYNAFGNAGATFYYTLTGNTDIFGSNSGPIIVNENTANLELIAESSIPDGESRQLGVQIRKDSVSGDIISVSNNIVIDSYISGTIAPRISRVANIVSNVSTSLANDTIEFTINTAAATEGETLYYTTLGNVSTFIGPSSGSTTVTGNTAVVTITPSYLLQVGNVRLQARRNSTSGPILGLSNMVNVEPNFEVFESLVNYTGGSIYESEAGIFRINTFYGTPGESTFYYRVLGNANIYSSITGTANSTANIEIIIESNVPNNQARSFEIVIFADELDGTDIARSGNITVNNLLPTVAANSRISLVNSITPNVLTSIATNNIKFTANTRAATNGETFYYVATGNAAPYVSGNTGSFTVTGNVGEITLRPIYQDLEIRELGLEVRRNSTSGLLLSTSDTVTVQPNVEVFVGANLSSTSIIESEAAEIRLVTKFAQNTRNYYYEVFGNATLASSTTGTQKANSNIIIISESNIPTGETRFFYVTIKEDNSSGNIVYTTPNITVSAYTGGAVNSKTSLITSVTANTTYVTKNNSVVYTINTLNAANGEVLYFSTSGNILSTDLNSGNTGSFSVNNNTATVTRVVSSGAVLTSQKVFDLVVRRGSSTGTVLNQSTQNTRTYDVGSYINATGGTITTAGGYRTHTFNSTDQFFINGISSTPSRNIIDYLIVAGGGGGGGTDGNGAAGGGGGGMINSTVTVGAGTYTITVGGGGSAGGGGAGRGGTGGPSSIVNFPGFLGQNVPVNLTGVGGGGGSSRYFEGTTGGSGGGAATYYSAPPGSIYPGLAGTPGQGNAGGSATQAAPQSNGGAGGGKGGVGGNSTASTVGTGGAGGTWPINSVIYAAGGGGSRQPNAAAPGGSGTVGGAGGGTGGTGSNTDAASGLTNRGGGGGGALAIGQNRAGGNGGSGIVIVRYPYA